MNFSLCRALRGLCRVLGPLGLATGLAAGSVGAAAPQRGAAPPRDRREPATTSLEETRITLRGTDLPLGAILSQIARSARLALVVDKDIQIDRVVRSPNLEDLPVTSALAVVLTPAGYSFAIDVAAGQLRIYVYDVRTFKVAMPVVVQYWDASMSNEGVGGAGVIGGGGGGAASAPAVGGPGSLGARVALRTVSETKGLWDEVEQALGHYMGEKGEHGTWSVNRVAGFATVRTLPSLMPAVAAYFEALNAEMGRAVAIETKVLQVDLNNRLSAGIDWNLLAHQLVQVGAAVIQGASTRSQIIPGVLPPAPDPMPSLRLSGPSGELFLRALEQQGTLNLLAQPNLVLGNNLPALIEVSTIQNYVAQQTVVLTEEGGAVTVQTATISDGLVLSILPRVLQSGEVSLAMAMVSQDVLGIRRENFGEGFVDLPRAARRSYTGVVRARLGESVVIGGLISERTEKRHSGIPFLSALPLVGWIFGATDDIVIRSELVISITPRAVPGWLPAEETSAPAAPPTADTD